MASIHETLIADEAAAAVDPDLRARARVAYELATAEGRIDLRAHMDAITYGRAIAHNGRLARLAVYLGLRDRSTVGGGALGYLDRQTVESDIRMAHLRAENLWGRK